MDSRICTICQQAQPLSTFHKRGKYYRSYCNACHAARERDRNRVHMQQVRANRSQEEHAALLAERRADYHARPEHSRGIRTRWYQENLAKARSQGRANHTRRKTQTALYVTMQRHLFPAKFKARMQSWRRRNEQHVQSYEQHYKATHPDYVQNKSQRRLARKRNAPRNDLTTRQWQEIVALYDHRCVYCGRTMQRLTQDHLTPLSKGGSHTADNVVPACRSCNSRKEAGPVLIPVQPVLLTIAPARKKKSS